MKAGLSDSDRMGYDMDIFEGAFLMNRFLVALVGALFMLGYAVTGVTPQAATLTLY